MNNTPALVANPTDATPAGIILPLGSPAELLVAFQQYQAVTEALLTDDDHQQIGRKRHPKKSAWRKLSTAFGVSCELQDRYIERDERGHTLSAEFTYRAIAPNGRHMDGWGSCDIKEKCCIQPCPKQSWESHTCCDADCSGAIHFSHPNHDIPATAETRAKNRAISDLIGKGEVSAEEILDAGGGEPRTAQPNRQQRGKQAQQQAAPAKPPVELTPEERAALVAAIQAKAPEHPKVKDKTVDAMSPRQLKALAESVGLAESHPPTPAPTPAPTPPADSSDLDDPDVKPDGAMGYFPWWVQQAERFGWVPNDLIPWAHKNGFPNIPPGLKELQPTSDAGKAIRAELRAHPGKP